MAIAIGQARVRKAAAGNDLAIALDGQPPAGQLHLMEKLGEGERGGKFTRRPV